MPEVVIIEHGYGEPNEEIRRKAETKIAAACCQILISVSFFACPLIKMRRYVDYEIPTMATDGVSMYFNPYFVDKMTIPELGFVILHEIFHYLLGHPFRRGSRMPEKWNYACDYVVNTMLNDCVQFAKQKKVSNGQSITWPKMPEGVLFDMAYNGMTAEQVYERLLDNSIPFGGGGNDNGGLFGNGMVDDHGSWNEKSLDEKDASEEQGNWKDMLTQTLHEMQKSCGSIPAGFERIFDNILKPKKNWRLLLQEFITPEADDYGFAPPDRRFSDYDFFLPDLNDCDSGSVKNGYFWIDTSGSIGSRELTVFYSEIVGAMDQFKGKLSGKLGFFDGKAYAPQDFADINDVLAIKPKGGGGTCFKAPFKHMKENNLFADAEFIVFLTDGYCDFPPESIAEGVKVLWVITTDVVAPWGKTIHLDMYNEK